ncbi:MAG: type II toxin-antitoxin system HicA family toxin [Chloroflexota bacterium]|nr:type II toxin-antitoxin system HicA family toxin [Chloroflexota bacterium]
MSKRAPRVTGEQVARALERAGWRQVHERGGGSHRHYEFPGRPGIVTIAVHAGKIVPPGTLSNILRQAGLTADELRELL